MNVTKTAAPRSRREARSSLGRSLGRLASVQGVHARTAVPFAVVTCVHLIGQACAGLGVPGTEVLHTVTKPLLMPALGLVLAEGLLDVRRRTGSLPRWAPVAGAAVGFSWLGDLALMHPDLFLAGVGAFGIAQACYVATFVKAGDATRTAGRPALAAPYVAWWLGLLGFFGATNGFTPMTGAVAAYGVLLGVMAFTANRVSTTAAVGAATFVLSDSLIGLGGGTGGGGIDIPFHGFLVMSTYLAAQWLIVRELVDAATDASQPLERSGGGPAHI